MKKRIDLKISLIVFLIVILVSIGGIAFSANYDNQEVNEIHILSDDYENNEDGEFHIIKSAKWISSNEAEIKFDIKTIESIENSKDIILVLDTSKSMEDDKISKLKDNTIDLVDKLLNNKNNKVSLITFSDESMILSDFTDNKEFIIEQVNNLEAIGVNTDYYKALKNVETILSTYEEKTNTDLVVLFLTDGYPNISNQVAQYRLLKENYPFITINGVQYELGKNVIKEIKDISDNQFIASQDTLENTLFKAVYMPKKYNKFVLTDYIDTRYWAIENRSDISTNLGSVSFDNNAQSFTWDLSDVMYSGEENVSLSVKVTLKDKFVETKGLYDTNIKTIVETVLNGNNNDIVETLETPKLKNYRTVTFDSNHPNTCGKNVYSEDHFIFSKVSKPQDEFNCPGYSYKGYEVVEDVNYINDDTFIIPAYDITVRGTWTKNAIFKSMDGTVREKLTLYKTVEKEYTSGSPFGGLYVGPDSENYANNVYYFKDDFKNGNVLFGGFCWKIIRTTDTGGVKVIYNGVPGEGGVCNNSGISTVVKKAAFNNKDNSPAYVGYMYNTIYSLKEYYHYDVYSIYSGIRMYNQNSYFIADSYEWDGQKYILKNTDGTDVKSLLWSDNYTQFEGKYMCLSSSSCEKVYYIFDVVNNSNINTIIMSSGLTSDEILNETLYFGKGYVENDGSYSLTDVKSVNRRDYYTNYRSFEKYYTCSNLKQKDECSQINHIYSIYNNQFSYMNSNDTFVFGNSYVYDKTTSMYTLVDTIDMWDIVNDGSKLSDYHYVCLDTKSNHCNKLYYVYQRSGIKLFYFQIDGTKTPAEMMYDMLWSEDVNSIDSNIKIEVDKWFEDNLLEYRDYIEDTVYCNNRKINDADIFNNYSNVNKWVKFQNNGLECANILDRFTVSDTIGNGKLKYPIALLNVGEHYLLSYKYINGNFDFFTMSPLSFHDVSSSMQLARVRPDGNIINYNVITWVVGVRPVISLRPDIQYSDGDGSVEYPYIIELDTD